MVNVNSEAIETKARSLLDKRVAAVRAVVAAQQLVVDAEAEHRDAWRAATRAGWTDAELKDVGLTKPVFPRSPRKRGSGAAEAPSEETSPTA